MCGEKEYIQIAKSKAINKKEHELSVLDPNKMDSFVIADLVFDLLVEGVLIETIKIKRFTITNDGSYIIEALGLRRVDEDE